MSQNISNYLYRILYTFTPHLYFAPLNPYFCFFQVFPDHPKVPPGWAYGECKDKKGLFPSNYAEKLPASKGDYVALTPTGTTPSQPSVGSGGGRSVGSIIAALNKQETLPISVAAPVGDGHEANEQDNHQVTM